MLDLDPEELNLINKGRAGKINIYSEAEAYYNLTQAAPAGWESQGGYVQGDNFIMKTLLLHKSQIRTNPSVSLRSHFITLRKRLIRLFYPDSFLRRRRNRAAIWRYLKKFMLVVSGVCLFCFLSWLWIIQELGFSFKTKESADFIMDCGNIDNIISGELTNQNNLCLFGNFFEDISNEISCLKNLGMDKCLNRFWRRYKKCKSYLVPPDGNCIQKIWEDQLLIESAINKYVKTRSRIDQREPEWLNDMIDDANNDLYSAEASPLFFDLNEDGVDEFHWIEGYGNGGHGLLWSQVQDGKIVDIISCFGFFFTLLDSKTFGYRDVSCYQRHYPRPPTNKYEYFKWNGSEYEVSRIIYSR